MASVAAAATASATTADVNDVTGCQPNAITGNIATSAAIRFFV